MALGNGGLGRLAACFLDSGDASHPRWVTEFIMSMDCSSSISGMVARLNAPIPGANMEIPEICRPESVQESNFMGMSRRFMKAGGFTKMARRRIIKAVPWDIPIVGYQGGNVNILRLWESRATNFSIGTFSMRGHVDAQAEQAHVEGSPKCSIPTMSRMPAKSCV